LCDRFPESLRWPVFPFAAAAVDANVTFRQGSLVDATETDLKHGKTAWRHDQGWCLFPGLLIRLCKRWKCPQPVQALVPDERILRR
jgi:hypothetical protein